MKGLATEKDPTLPTGRQALRLPKVGPWHFLFLTFLLFFMSGHTALAGVIRKPPNNLGLTGYWALDDGAVGTSGGVAGDSSGNRRNGLLTVTGLFGPPIFVIGKRGNAVSFDGVNDVVTTAVQATQLFSHSTSTISVWVKPTGTSPTASEAYIAARIVGTNAGVFSLGIGRGVVGGVDKIWAFTYASGNTKVGVDYTNDVWTHIVLVHASSTLYIYKNGVLGGSVASGDDVFSSQLWFGAGSGGTNFAGTIDEVRTYNRALEPSDIAYLYQSGSTKIGFTNKSPGTLANGLTGYWTFDGKDISGTSATDRSGNGYTGTLTNGPVSAIGKIGQALAFDGVNDYMDANALFTNFIGNNEGTVSAWIRPRGTAPSASAAAIYNSRSAVSSLTTFSSFGISRANNTTFGGDMIWAYNEPSCGSYNSAGVSYNTDEWVHITWVHSGGTLYLYKNGDLATSTSSGGTVACGGAADLSIGTTWTAAGNRFWNGDIDEVRTYNRALTASEIKQVHNIGAQKVGKTSTPTGSLQTGLKGWWTFDGKDMVSNVADVSGNGNNGTLTNFTSTTTAIGKIGQALNFDGVDDMVNVGLNASLKPGTGSYSVSLWYKGISGTGEVFARQGVCIAAGKPCWYIADTSASFGMDVYPFRIANMNFTLPTDNEWHHLVVVLNRTPSPDTLVAYVDGTATGTQTSNSLDNDNLIPTNTSTYFSGSVAGGDIMRQGPMDDVRIYNKALSATEVKQLYNLGK